MAATLDTELYNKLDEYYNNKKTRAADAAATSQSGNAVRDSRS